MQDLLTALDALMDIKPVILAIDGPCGGGKSTLAERLQARYQGAAVFHMDDFFLQPAMRSPERLSEPGGNVGRERFLAEVLLPLQGGNAFTYQKYDCQSGLLSPIQAQRARLNIVEGSYSLHPDLRPYYDLSVFLDVAPDVQAKRILMRSGERLAERFFKEWIPLENAYFEAFAVREAADILFAD